METKRRLRVSGVHPSTIAGSLCALAVGHALVAACSLALHGRTPRGASGSRAPGAADRTLLGFAALNLAVVGLDGSLAVASALAPDDGPMVLVSSLRIAEASRVVAAAVVLHFALQYVRARRPLWSLGVIYGTAGLFGIAYGIGAEGDARLERALLAGVSVPFVRVPASPLGGIGAILALLAALVAFVVVARGRQRGGREAIGLAGLAILVATLVHDAALHLGWVGGPLLAPLGYLALVNGVAMTLLSRFSALRRELERRARDLDDRASELERAYAELRAAQDEIVRKEQLAAIGELSAVIAHEVRNPLAIISNAVATLKRSGIGQDDKDTLLGILDEETTRLNRLVGDLLRYARPIAIERRLVSLRDLVERGTALARGKIGLDVDIVEPEPTEKIWADPNLLRQVIENLVDNAVQAMSSGGALTVTLVNAESDGARGVELQIQDTGEGMDTGVRSRALDPFFTTRPSGTGLGLAIVSRIVDAHGGSILIKSQPGTGTVMHVFLPQADKDARVSRPSDARLRDSLSGEGERKSIDALLPPELMKELEGPRRG
jgi:signal transduction histidine kinase